MGFANGGFGLGGLLVSVLDLCRRLPSHTAGLLASSLFHHPVVIRRAGKLGKEGRGAWAAAGPST